MKLRTLRIVSQTVFLTLFVFSFFFLNTNPTALQFESEWFLWLNPLVALLSSIASRSFIFPAVLWGGVTLAATVVLGRFFCGAVCPLGTLIDISDRLLKKTYSAKRRPPLYMQRLKYVLLIAMVLLAVFGSVLPLFFDPISLVTRMFSLVVYPLVIIIGTDWLQPLARLAHVHSLAYATLKQPLFYGIGATVLLMGFIFGAAFIDRRFWCQYVCPSGAFFGLLSRFALFRRRVDAAKCNECRLCVNRTCPTRAISDKQVGRTAVSECIVCGACSADRKMCTSFSFRLPESVLTAAPDLNRRNLLQGTCAGLVLAPVLRADALMKRDTTGRMIRPPGAVPESGFAARCLGCGECMKVCPTNALQPATLADGLRVMNTPRIVPRIGGCEEKCHACGQVCPTQAIRALEYEEKRFVKIGTAVIDRSRCLAWEQNKECLVCDEVCPYNAITARYIETTTGHFRVPVVDEDLCLGCGMCEQHCPIFDQAAIVIYKFGENRLAEGPYITEAQKEQVLARRAVSDDHIGESMTGASTSAVPPGFDSGSNEAGQQGLPPGFSD